MFFFCFPSPKQNRTENSFRLWWFDDYSGTYIHTYIRASYIKLKCCIGRTNTHLIEKHESFLTLYSSALSHSLFLFVFRRWIIKIVTNNNRAHTHTQWFFGHVPLIWLVWYNVYPSFFFFWTHKHTYTLSRLKKSSKKPARSFFIPSKSRYYYLCGSGFSNSLCQNVDKHFINKNNNNGNDPTIITNNYRTHTICVCVIDF